MSSINISITEDVYETLKRLKKDDESFSEVIKNLAKQKDITKCFGLLADYKKDLELVEKKVIKARKEKWRDVSL